MYAPSLGRHRNNNENKAIKSNLIHRQYEDQQDSYQVRHGDSSELRQLKSKVKVLVGKLANGKKERDQLVKNNQNMHKEMMEMQNNLRHMVVGFNNTSSSFPMPNELINKINQFYKCDCLDLFFDILAPEELTIKGVIYFYMQIFAAATLMVDKHFQPGFSKVKEVGCLDSLEGPVLNVLRKAFQTKHQDIIEKIVQKDTVSRKVQVLADELGLGNVDREEAIVNINNFFMKLVEIILECRICDPPLMMEVAGIGRRVEFSNLNHDPFDGFIKGKQECYVILPQVRKEEGGEVVVKGLVLPKDYDPTT